MIRAFLTVSTGTMASRLLGFARDAMIAALLGAGPVADAFLVAFQLVNVIRRLLTEGALNTALVPAWLRVREAEGAVAAAAFAGRVLGTISVALVMAAAAIGLLMPLVITALAPGFAGHSTLQLAVDNARLMLPYLAFAGPATVMMALLSAQHRFVLTAFSPLLFNIALIAVMIVLLGWRKDAADAALVIAATVGIAGLLQLLILVWRRGDENTATPLRIAFDAPMRNFLGKAIPGMIASAGPQLLIVAGAIIASSSPSAVSWLYFANRLIELPLGIVGVAMGTVLVPELTRALRGDDPGLMRHAESRGLELAVGLALPPAFFAREDTITPLLATLKGLAVAIVAALLLGRLFGASGVAASIALGAWSNAFGLIRRGAAISGFSIDPAARRRLPRIMASALAMGALLWWAERLALAPAADAHGVVQAALLALLIAGGIAVYGLLLTLFGAVNWAESIQSVRPSPPPDLRI
jgi:putative peptidoglycan lipid II flippase